VLSFDKRGTGASSGDWQTASFDVLADDLLAGVAYLRSRADVDPTRLGIWAISQGGWVASLAAARSADIRFLIVHAGSGVSVAENVVYEMEGFMRAAGLAEQDVQDGLAYARELTELASDGAPYESVRARFAEADGKPWAPFVYLHDAPKDDYQWAWYRSNGRVDPARVLPGVRCPVLWFLGERDRLVDARASEPRLREALAPLAEGAPKAEPKAAGANANAIVVPLDMRLRSLVPKFLSNCGRDLARLRAALAGGDLAAARAIGHSLRGVGGSYGFEEITRIGRAIEERSIRGDAASVSSLAAQLEDYLARVQPEYR